MTVSPAPTTNVAVAVPTSPEESASSHVMDVTTQPAGTVSVAE